ncbi:Ankyrin repeat protein 1 [Giardia muris]|uniref:Ankyrin repeat protein 1 n=1 Tax=Giardia muris TaxID=5742 RepID=A0A4Z1SQW8_GIAMU|nr:Ankyrin repeat protein 1 [Giardia muris]|eukprot:TNJ28274.1 Ankyrin repeat protein 1 [Giardia muris]
MLAAHYNHPDIVELLLPYEQGLTDSKGHNAQWHAKNSTRGGDFTRVNELLENEGTERIPPPPKGLLLFLKSAMMGDVDGVRKHLDHAGYRSSNGTTALMMAVSNGHINCAHLLLSEAGKQTTKDWNGLPPGTTALMIAAHRNYPEVVGFIYPYEQGKRDANGKTALMKAAEEGHVSCALLLRGETGMQDKDGWTALMWAVWNGHTNCVRLLLSEVGV